MARTGGRRRVESDWRRATAGSEPAYDPSPDLYDDAQTKAATMNYVKSRAKQLGPKA